MPEGTHEISGGRFTVLESGSVGSRKRGKVQVTIDSGSQLEELGDLDSVSITVDQGILRLTVTEGTGTARVGGGDAIQSPDGSMVLAKQGACDVASGHGAALGPKNSFVIKGGALQMAAADEPVVLTMDAQTTEDLSPLRCWICPVM